MYIEEKIKARTVFTVRSLDWYNQFKDEETNSVINPCDNCIEFYEEMSKYCGQKVTVEEDCNIWDEIHLVEDKEYAWGSWMFVEFLDPFIEFSHHINEEIKILERVNFEGGISDGYHTFSSLYDIRKVYNAALFNEWGLTNKYNVHKSKKHYDGELCFGGGWFIVTAELPTGQISNHYRLEDWDLFKIPETEEALFEFDGHGTQDVIDRLKDLC